MLVLLVLLLLDLEMVLLALPDLEAVALDSPV